MGMLEEIDLLDGCGNFYHWRIIVSSWVRDVDSSHGGSRKQARGPLAVLSCPPEMRVDNFLAKVA